MGLLGHGPDWEAAEVVESEPHYWKSVGSHLDSEDSTQLQSGLWTDQGHQEDWGEPRANTKKVGPQNISQCLMKNVLNVWHPYLMHLSSPTFLLAQNLSSKQIVPTDNKWPNFDEDYSHHW